MATFATAKICRFFTNPLHHRFKFEVQNLPQFRLQTQSSKLIVLHYFLAGDGDDQQTEKLQKLLN